MDEHAICFFAFNPWLESAPPVPDNAALRVVATSYGDPELPNVLKLSVYGKRECYSDHVATGEDLLEVRCVDVASDVDLEELLSRIDEFRGDHRLRMQWHTQHHRLQMALSWVNVARGIVQVAVDIRVPGGKSRPSAGRTLCVLNEGHCVFSVHFAFLMKQSYLIYVRSRITSVIRSIREAR